MGLVVEFCENPDYSMLDDIKEFRDIIKKISVSKL